MYKLVLVDDDAEIRNGLSQYFPWTQLDYSVEGVFGNGKKALEFLEEHEADVVLCDISMPVMSGLELAGELHRRGSRTKVLLLSGYREFEYAQQALEYQVKGYIVKPTRYEELHHAFTKLKAELDREREQKDEVPEVRPSGNSGLNRQVAAVISQYVNEHYAMANLEEAASIVHMNPDYLSKYFKQATGRNFSEYLLQVRMEKAALLLQDIRYKTYEVSELVGYSQAKNFTRTFRKYYGMSPREFRNGTGAAKAGS